VFSLLAFSAGSAVILLAPSLATAADPPWIFGLHDPGGAGIMVEAGKPGWITFTEEIGHNPWAYDGPDYTPYTSKGHGIIARLNNGYGQGGTIPYVKHHDDFAQRCANYVAASRGGCHIWIIGNEPNLYSEWPAYDGWLEPITASNYIACFLKVRAKIKALPGHAADQVLPAAVGTWGFDSRVGDWIDDYWKPMLAALDGKCDGLVIHTYTHGANPAFVTDNVKMLTRPDRYWHFRAYIDYMNLIPASMRSLPVYITETDQDVPWDNVNSGWVKEAYKEINRWNQTQGTQKIRALCLYRWPKVDQWYIDGKWGVINDWRDAMQNDYRWAVEGTPPPPPPPPPPGSDGAPAVLADGTLKWEAENFSGGSSPVSGTDYADNSVGNAGGQYRASDVDIENCSEGGYNVGWTASGEWLRFIFAGGGTYQAKVRYAGIAAASIRIEVDGADQTGPIALPSTGGYQTWATASASSVFTVPSGAHVVKVVCGSANFNVNWFSFSPATAPPPPPPPPPTTGPDGSPTVLADGALQWEAENYSGGTSAASGVDYADSTPGNDGGQYRTQGVDIERASEGGYNVGWTNPGEWTRYVFSGGGTYQVKVRFAAIAQSAVHIEVDGANKTGPIVLPVTGGWQTWATATSGTVFTLPTGSHVVKFVCDSGGFNVNWFQFVPATAPPPPPPPPPATGPDGTPAVLADGSLRWEAENYSGGTAAASGVDYYDSTAGNSGGQYRSQAVDIERCSEGGYNVGWTAAGEWMRYTFTGGGTYRVSVRYAATWNAVVHVEVDGANVSGSIPFNATGGWQTWATASGATFTVPSGSHVVRFLSDSAGYNVNWFQFQPVSAPPPPSGLPDTIVEALWTSPSAPRAGQPVTFGCRVKNIGTGSVPSTTSVGVAYYVNGAYKTWGAVAGPLAAGATVTIGTNSVSWTPPAAGTYTILAFVDDVNRYGESNENNNQLSLTITVAP
jgi:hypothetical protein